MPWTGATACSGELWWQVQGTLLGSDGWTWLGPTQDGACRWVLGKPTWLVEQHRGAGGRKLG